MILACILLTGCAFAGGSIFSSNGHGEQQIGGGIRARGLGGGAIAVADSMSFATTNPALLSFAKRTTFRLGAEAAIWSTTSNDRTDTDSELLWRDFFVGFPVTGKWNIGFGAAPAMYMDIRTFTNGKAEFPDVASDTIEAVYEQRDIWQGGSVEWRIDNSFRVHDRFSFGISAIYTTLHNERERIIDFEEIVNNSYYFDTDYLETERFTGWSLTMGIYARPTNNLSIGAVFRPRSSGQWRYELSKRGTDSTIERHRSGDSPGQFSLGMGYHLRKNLLGVADFRTGQWSKGDLGIMADRANLPKPENPLFLSAGIERIAGKPPITSGFQNWGLRSAVFYRKHYWPLRNDKPVEDLGLTVGASIPFDGAQSYLHIAIEGGMRGLDDDKLGAGELFFRTSLQLEISETWFQRTKPRIPK